MSAVTGVAGSTSQVNVTIWPHCAMPKTELAAALTFMAYKTGKTVNLAVYRGSVRYSPDAVNVYICTSENRPNPIPLGRVLLGGVEHKPDGSQPVFSISGLLGKTIKDDEGRTLAKVDHNCVVILVEVTAADNEAGRAILSYVVERAIPLFDFDVTKLAERQQAELLKNYGEFYRAAIRSRLDGKANDVQRLERETENLYYQLVQAERDLPLAKQELDALEKQSEKKNPELVQKQAAAILALITNGGQYEEVTPCNDGGLTARTANIIIEHDDWTFEMGRYDISIESNGKVSIVSADGTDADGYPHPHVDTSGRPCLGNIAPDLARAIGQMRIAEALTLLYDFLSSYNSDGPYIRLGRFDPNYNDPDEDPCDDCEDYHSPYCICECSHNDGDYSCGDCCEYRTDYCYQECSYNLPGFQYLSPCDTCEEGEEYCFLECQYNQKWEQKNPCEGCERKDNCDDCDYAEKKLSLSARDVPAPSSKR